MAEYLTSEQWVNKLRHEGDNTNILDPDGWDKANFQYSFYEENITEQEFLRRRSHSTTQLVW